MKKIILSITIVMACLTANAQEPEKKKETPPPATRGQERAINEPGVSVKSEDTKKSNSNSKKTAPSPQPAAKPADPPKDTKKPE